MTVRSIPFAELQPGQKLQKTIYDDNGRLLLRAGTTLTFRHLQLMKDWGLDRVEVSGEWPEDSTEMPLVHVIDAALQGEMLSAIAEVFASVAEDKALDLARIASSTASLVQEVTGHSSVTLDLVGLRQVDNYTFMHSLAVGVLSVAAGVELGFKQDDLLDLSLAAVLHDVGKSRIPLQVLNKPGKLDADEWQLMKRHPRLGTELLSERGGLSTTILQGVYEHHERSDGSGYPHSRSGGVIGRLGKIIAVADFYDAITSDRVYRPGTEPHLAVEQLIAESLSSYDREAVRAFIRGLAVYPVGSTVVMDNGGVGRVIGYDRDVPHRPKVQIVCDQNGLWLPEPQECDMMRELSRFIKEVRKVS